MSTSSWASARSRALRSGNGKTASLPVNIAMAGRNTRASKGEKPCDLPAVRGNKVAVGSGWPVDQAFEPEPPQVVGHLVGCVLRYTHTQQVGHVLAQIVIAKAVNQMVEQRERQKQCHHARLSELQAR